MESKFEKFLRLILAESIFVPVSLEEKENRYAIYRKKLELPEKWIHDVIGGNIEGMKECLAKGIDVNDVTTGSTALNNAIFNSNVDTVRFLLSLPNTDVNFTNDNGTDTPLITAIYNIDKINYNKIMEIVRMLLEHKDIDPNETSLTGKFPLYIAAVDIKDPLIPEIVEMIASHPKTDVNKRSQSDYTVIDMLEFQKKHSSPEDANIKEQMIEILKKHGATE